MCSTEKCQMFILKKFLANKLKLVCLLAVCVAMLAVGCVVPLLPVRCLCCLCRPPFRLVCLCVRISQVHLIALREALVEHTDKV